MFGAPNRLGGQGVRFALGLAGLLGCASPPSTQMDDVGPTASSDPAFASFEPPTLQIGRYRGDVYEAFDQGADCPFVNASQGGLWAMPTLRIRGVGTPAVVCCSVTSTAGILADQKIRTRFNPVDEWGERREFPIPFLDHAAAELEGLPVAILCEVTDDASRGGAQEVQVVLSLDWK